MIHRKKTLSYGNRAWRDMVTSQVAPGVIRIWGKVGMGSPPPGAISYCGSFDIFSLDSRVKTE